MAVSTSELEILNHSGMASHPGGNLSRKLHGQAIFLNDTGRWGAWVRIPKIRTTSSWIFLGSHLTRRLAARSQDRALLKLEADSPTSVCIELTFLRKDYDEDEPLRRTLSDGQFFDLLREESSTSNDTTLATTCFGKFMMEEKALGNLPTIADNLSTIALEGPFYDIDLHEESKIPSACNIPSDQLIGFWNSFLKDPQISLMNVIFINDRESIMRKYH